MSEAKKSLAFDESSAPSGSQLSERQREVTEGSGGEEVYVETGEVHNH